MPFAYAIHCTRPGCPHLAAYKVASRWSDGLTEELKTYALACADCLPALFRRSLQRQRDCRLTRGETLEPPGIYQLVPGQHDEQRERLPQLEQLLSVNPP